MLGLSLFLLANACSTSTRNHWSTTAIGVLFNHGFAEDNSVIGILHPPDTFRLLTKDDKSRLWRLLGNATSSTVPLKAGKELRIEADGAGAARIVVDSKDIVLIQPFLYEMDKPITALHDKFQVPGLYKFITSLSNNPSIRTKQRHGEGILRAAVSDQEL